MMDDHSPDAAMERPKRIWLLHGEGEGGSDVWCDDPHPNLGDRPDSTEYIRVDALKPGDQLPGGLRVVREEPTVQMYEAALEADPSEWPDETPTDLPAQCYRAVWHAMLDASGEE